VTTNGLVLFGVDLAQRVPADSDSPADSPRLRRGAVVKLMECPFPDQHDQWSARFCDRPFKEVVVRKAPPQGLKRFLIPA
jgi:hypothetical protein